MTNILSTSYIDLLNTVIDDEYIIDKVNGGSTHYVYKVSTKNSIYFLKIRADHYASNPSIPLDKLNLHNEVEALKTLSSFKPQITPKIVGYDLDLSVIVLTSVGQDDFGMLNRLLSQLITTKEIESLALSLSRLHDQLSKIPERPTDNKLFNQYIFHHIDSLDHPEFIELSEILKTESWQMILGDPSPKNIAFSKNQAYFFDFDSYHFGSRLYEIGFVAAHILLHCRNWNKDLYEIFLGTYLKTSKEKYSDRELKIISDSILATIIYRLDNHWVKYAHLDLTDLERTNILEQVKSLLKTSSHPLELTEYM